MDALGIDTADIGLPGAGGTHAAGVERLAREIVEQKLRIRPNCAARTHQNDIRPIAEISQRAGIPIEACTFIGSSPDPLLRRGLDARQASAAHGGGRHLRRQRRACPSCSSPRTRRAPTPRRSARSTRRPSAPARAPCASATPSATPRPTARARSSASSRASSKSEGERRPPRLARPSGSRPRRHQLHRGDRGRRRSGARLGARRRRARRQHADGSTARQPQADGLDRQRPVAPARVLRQGRRSAAAGRSRSTTRSSGATPSARRRACTPRPSSRAYRKGDDELADLVYSGVPAGLVRDAADDRDRPDERQVERRLLARIARPRSRPTSASSASTTTPRARTASSAKRK